MASSTAAWWHPIAAYLYILHLDGPALAWEYLRRHPDYQHDWRCRHRHAALTAHRWGLCLLEDPAHDARDATPAWMPDPDRLLQILPDTGGATPFRLWRFPGHKHLVHDGTRLLLTCRLADRILRAALAPTLQDGMACAYAVRAGDRLRARWRAGGAELTLLDGAQAAAAAARSRPGATALGHLRTLQALDATLAGASQREVAEVWFGRAVVAAQWHGDSDLRAQVRRAIRRGQAFMRGGYRHLLHGEGKG
ncbi:DUF2285 domain-containing protein [Rhodanobacter glycinis]|uniref:DUF2285 domain-containing protein n=1 Tax=Rhodanobacter glycinis TaxID=582702 RepID=A0A5B9E2P8_9GAMM|nr:DUF2285 domain-containing protein [Rhodanobacter glycinis]QEE24951.1 DUF2285 domain-containing protein [Rhodanobacter glycinis]